MYPSHSPCFCDLILATRNKWNHVLANVDLANQKNRKSSWHTLPDHICYLFQRVGERTTTPLPCPTDDGNQDDFWSIKPFVHSYLVVRNAFYRGYCSSESARSNELKRLTVEEHQLIAHHYEKSCIEFAWEPVYALLRSFEADSESYNTVLFLHLISDTSLTALSPQPESFVSRNSGDIWKCIQWLHAFTTDEAFRSQSSFYLQPFLPSNPTFLAIQPYVCYALRFVSLRSPEDNVMAIRWLLSEMGNLKNDYDQVTKTINHVLLNAPQLSYLTYAVGLSQELNRMIILPFQKGLTQPCFSIQKTILQILVRDSPDFWNSTIAKIVSLYTSNTFRMIYTESTA